MCGNIIAPGIALVALYKEGVGLGAISSVTVQTMPISLCVGLGTITAVTVWTMPSSLSDGEIRNGCLQNH